MEAVATKILIHLAVKYGRQIIIFFLVLFVAITGLFIKPVKFENVNVVNAIDETKQYIGIEAVTITKNYPFSLADLLYAFPTTGTITQRVSDVGYAGNSHYAWDIANSADMVPVYAVFDGTVTVSKINTQYTNYQWRFCSEQGGICYDKIDEYKDIVFGCGNEIQIESSRVETLRIMYCHLDNRLVNAGQQVKMGDIIGYMGSTGWSTGKHLHFSYYYKGDPVDPKYFYEKSENK